MLFYFDFTLYLQRFLLFSIGHVKLFMYHIVLNLSGRQHNCYYVVSLLPGMKGAAMGFKGFAGKHPKTVEKVQFLCKIWRGIYREMGLYYWN
ncbi:hypothetical protein CBFG_03238 [Clostridiales bacterium 1_7_47FAA]|nr:hypothetical protein CBFG_03238 [Clostridiales bacterium 1_7_47FAA]